MRALLLSVILLGCGRAPAEKIGVEDRTPEVTAVPAEATPSTGSIEPLEAVPTLSGIREAKGSLTTLYVQNEKGELESYNTRCGEPQLQYTGPVVGKLLDVDDQGNAYVFMPETGDSEVVQISPSGARSTVVEAGRGIWDFAISPEGNTMYVTSCGPTGIFVYPSSPLQTAIEPPETLWNSYPSALTSNGTLWSVGYGAKTLVRTTASGSTTLGDTGDATLMRCGVNVCGVKPGEVREWDEQGTLLRTVPAPAGTTIVSATGDRTSLFLVVATATERKLVHVSP